MFVDLDAEDSPDLQSTTAFRTLLEFQEKYNDPFRLTIGQWILQGSLNYPNACLILLRFDCYRETKAPGLLDELAHFVLQNQLDKDQSKAFYNAGQICMILSKFYSTDEQRMLLSVAQNKKFSRSRG